MIPPTEIAILSRIIKPEKPELPAALARQVLRWKFPPKDRQRMIALLNKAKNDRLTTNEKIEAERYERIGHFLSILKSQARMSLKVNGDHC
jgi:hypothetical protein